MLKSSLLLLAAMALAAAADPWSTVRDLARGTELRIYRTGAKQPVVAKFDNLSGEALIVLEKNAQIAIPKEEVARVDARAADSGRTSLEARRNVGTPEDARLNRTGGKKLSLPAQSTAGGIRIEPKAGFETVYRRPAEGAGK